MMKFGAARHFRLRGNDGTSKSGIGDGLVHPELWPEHFKGGSSSSGIP
jgi:hypothetical protein